MSNIAALVAVKRDAGLLQWAGVFFVLWLTCTGPLRWVAGSALPAWLLGSAPNFFAGLTLACWKAFVVPSPPIRSAAIAFMVLGFVEVVQLAMPQHRADAWDLLASLLACSLAAAGLSRRCRVAQHGP